MPVQQTPQQGDGDGHVVPPVWRQFAVEQLQRSIDQMDRLEAQWDELQRTANPSNTITITIVHEGETR